jgi:SulP family sulfate permease
VAHGINFVDIAGAYLLAEEARRRRALGGGLLLVGAQASVQRMLSRSDALPVVGPDHLLAHKPDALAFVYPLLDSAICQRCPRPVFEECQHRLPDGRPRAGHLPASTPPKGLLHE